MHDPVTGSLGCDSKKRSEFIGDRTRLFFREEVSTVTNGATMNVREEGA